VPIVLPEKNKKLLRSSLYYWTALSLGSVAPLILPRYSTTFSPAHPTPGPFLALFFPPFLLPERALLRGALRVKHPPELLCLILSASVYRLSRLKEAIVWPLALPFLFFPFFFLVQSHN